jgi:hypothetical protein
MESTPLFQALITYACSEYSHAYISKNASGVACGNLLFYTWTRAGNVLEVLKPMSRRSP